MPQAYPAFPSMTFGADPELFVINSEGNPVCADGLIPGTKDEPYKVDCGAVQVDGMAAEFNIDPVDNYNDWRDNIKTVMNELTKMLPNGYKLIPQSTVKFSQEEWEKAPERAKVLGCSPDFNAWKLSVNPAPSDTDLVRHVGGHIHFGWTKHASPDNQAYYRSCVDLVRQLDWYLGLWSITRDSDSQRRKMYGQAGSMRFKPYGVEYRTLSNFWLNDYMGLLNVWNRMQVAIHDMATNHMPTEQLSFNKLVIKSINSSSLNTGLENIFYSPIKKVTFNNG